MQKDSHQAETALAIGREAWSTTGSPRVRGGVTHRLTPILGRRCIGRCAFVCATATIGPSATPRHPPGWQSKMPYASAVANRPPSFSITGFLTVTLKRWSTAMVSHIEASRPPLLIAPHSIKAANARRIHGRSPQWTGIACTPSRRWHVRAVKPQRKWPGNCAIEFRPIRLNNNQGDKRNYR